MKGLAKVNLDYSINKKNTEYLALVQKLMNNSNIKKIVEISFGQNTLAFKYNNPDGKKYIGIEEGERSTSNHILLAQI